MRANARAKTGSLKSSTIAWSNSRVDVAASQIVQATPAGPCTLGSGSNNNSW